MAVKAVSEARAKFSGDVRQLDARPLSERATVRLDDCYGRLAEWQELADS